MISRSCPKVLIINGSERMVATLKSHLQKAGCEVVAHMSSLGIIVAIMEERPDLIVLDVHMPIIDGPILCRLVQKNRLISGTPILLYSSLAEEPLRRKVAQWQAQGYIRNGWNGERVAKLIAHHLTAVPAMNYGQVSA
ncbi:MAG: response regulator [Acidobacteriota bacterium]